MKGLRFLLLCGAAIVAGCSGGPRSPDFLAESTVEKIEIFKGTQNVTEGNAGAVNIGDTLTLTARAVISTTVPPGTSGAVNSCNGNAKPQPVVCEERDVTDEAEWSSASSNIATVDRGVVTGRGVGTTNVFAKLGGKSAKTSVTVDPARLLEVVVNPAEATVSQGGTVTFLAQGRYSDAPGTTRDLNAGTTVTWSIDRPNLATLTPTTGRTTTARASSTETGDATVTAAVTGATSGTAALHVVTVNITRILELRCVPNIIRAPIPPSTPATTSQCTAIAQRTDGGTEARPASEFDWTADPTSVATVDANGKVTGVSPGRVVITAALKSGLFPTITGTNRSASAPIAVTGPICTGPLLESNGATVAVANTPLCIGCSVDGPENVIDGDEATAAVMTQTLGLVQGELSLTVTQLNAIPAGGTAGFLIRQPAGELLSLELMNQVAVTVLEQDGSGAFTEVARENTPLRLTLLGRMGDEDVFLASINTPAATPAIPAFDALRLTFTSGIATALGQVNALAACGTAVVPEEPAP